MCFSVSYVGFFAKSHIMFFLPSSFRFLPPFKNDGRGELRFLQNSINTCLSFLNGRKKAVENSVIKKYGVE